MRAKIIFGLGMWAMAIILFIATLIAIKWVIEFATWATLDSGWTQAIGGLLAVWAALYVYLRQTKAQNDIALITAKLAAIRIANDLAGTAGQAKGSAMRMQIEGPQVTIETLSKIHDANFWERCRLEDIALLAALPNQCAHNLAHAFAQFSAARQAIYMAIHGDPKNTTAFASNAALAYTALNMGVDYINVALVEIKRHIDPKAPPRTPIAARTETQ